MRDIDDYESYTREITTFEKYKETVNNILHSRKYMKTARRYIWRYNQPRRNAYKINKNQYGGLIINVQQD